MSRPEDIALELHEELLKEPTVQEYLRLKELYFNSPELNQMRSDIARLRSEQKEEEWKNLLDVYERNHLVINYKNSLEEVRELLLEIKEIISD